MKLQRETTLASMMQPLLPNKFYQQ